MKTGYISIGSARISPHLSPQLADRIPDIIDRILVELGGDVTASSTRPTEV